MGKVLSVKLSCTQTGFVHITCTCIRNICRCVWFSSLPRKQQCYLWGSQKATWFRSIWEVQYCTLQLWLQSDQAMSSSLWLCSWNLELLFNKPCIPRLAVTFVKASLCMPSLQLPSNSFIYCKLGIIQESLILFPKLSQKLKMLIGII